MNDLISRREVTAILDKYRVPDSVYHEINKLHEFSADREKECKKNCIYCSFPKCKRGKAE